MTNKRIKSVRFGGSPADEIRVALKDIAKNCGLSEAAAAQGIADLELAGLIKKVGEDKYKIMIQ